MKVLCCPETHQSLALADSRLLDELNQKIGSGAVRSRGGRVIMEQLTEGLVRADGKILYPIRQGIPVMLIDEGIVLTPPAA